MGQNCCSAAGEKSLPNRANHDASAAYRNARQSPTWSFRWDNRTHIEDIMEGSVLYSHRDSRSSASEVKSAAGGESNGPSEGGSRAISLRRKSFINGGSESSKLYASASKLHLPSSSDIKPASITSASKSEDPSSSLVVSSVASNPTSLRQSIRSSGRLQIQRQISDSHISPLQSPIEGISLEARRHSVGSHGILSSRWSMRTSLELIASSQRALLSLDGGNLKAFESSLKSCSICSQSLREKSPWSSHNIVSTNDLPVSAVLVCGHAYHAECLEASTPDADMYDPPCQECLNKGNQLTTSKAVINSNAGEDSNLGPRLSSKGSSMGASSSMKRSFLRRNFSMGSRRATTRSTSENGAMIKKWFWPRYLRED